MKQTITIERAYNRFANHQTLTDWGAYHMPFGLYHNDHRIEFIRWCNASQAWCIYYAHSKKDNADFYTKFDDCQLSTLTIV